MPTDPFEYMGWTLEKIGAIDGSIGMYAITFHKGDSHRTVRIAERLYMLPWEELLKAPEFPFIFNEAIHE